MVLAAHHQQEKKKKKTDDEGKIIGKADMLIIESVGCEISFRFNFSRKTWRT